MFSYMEYLVIDEIDCNNYICPVACTHVKKIWFEGPIQNQSYAPFKTNPMLP